MHFFPTSIGIKLVKCLEYSKEMSEKKHQNYVHILTPLPSFSQVMPSYVSHGWRVKKPFSELLPEVDAQGERRELSSGKKRKVKQYKIEQ